MARPMPLLAPVTSTGLADWSLLTGQLQILAFGPIYSEAGRRHHLFLDRDRAIERRHRMLVHRDPGGDDERLARREMIAVGLVVSRAEKEAQRRPRTRRSAFGAVIGRD